MGETYSKPETEKLTFDSIVVNDYENLENIKNKVTTFFFVLIFKSKIIEKNLNKKKGDFDFLRKAFSLLEFIPLLDVLNKINELKLKSKILEKGSFELQKYLEDNEEMLPPNTTVENINIENVMYSKLPVYSSIPLLQKIYTNETDVAFLRVISFVEKMLIKHDDLELVINFVLYNLYLMDEYYESEVL